MLNSRHLAPALAQLSPMRRLFILNLVWETNDNQINRNIAERVRVQQCAEDGMIAVVEGGRDCDGVRYSGDVRLIPANWLAYVQHYNQRAEWADGPFNIAIMRPSDAKGIEYTSRDLTLEAFEDGHAHCIYA